MIFAAAVLFSFTSVTIGNAEATLTESEHREFGRACGTAVSTLFIKHGDLWNYDEYPTDPDDHIPLRFDPDYTYFQSEIEGINSRGAEITTRIERTITSDSGWGEEMRTTYSIRCLFESIVRDSQVSNPDLVVVWVPRLGRAQCASYQRWRNGAYLHPSLGGNSDEPMYKEGWVLEHSPIFSRRSACRRLKSLGRT